MNDAASMLVGTSTVMEEVRALLRKASLSLEPVLLVGAPGTGKDVAAKAIHSLSARSAGPYVVMNCYALSDVLLEYGLFGVTQEAFSGPRKEGRVEQAEGGTLILDGVGEVSPAFQLKLLRLIQQKQYSRLGRVEVVTANVRVIAATHRSLPEMVKAGTFHEDLYACLSAVQIALPPLRDRLGDLEELVLHFLSHFGPRYGHQSGSVTPGALALLAAGKWFDNVLSLEIFIERLVVLAPPGDIVIDEASLASERPPGARLLRPTREARTEAERQMVQEALEKAGGNRSRAARILGVSRRTLYNKLEELGLASTPE